MESSVLTLRGLKIQTSEIEPTDDGSLRLEVVTTRSVTLEFRLAAPEASQLGYDLLYGAEVARNRKNSKRDDQSGPESIFAPLASILDVGTVLGREEVALTFQLENGQPQQIRFRNDEILALAKQAILNLDKSTTNRH